MAKETLGTLIAILLVFALIVVTFMVVVLGIRNVVPFFMGLGEETTTTTFAAGDGGAGQDGGDQIDYVEKIMRIKEISPSLDVYGYEMYSDWSDSNVKLPSSGGWARIGITFNNPVNLTRLKDAIEVWQEKCIGTCVSGTSTQGEYKLLAYGDASDEWKINQLNERIYEIVVPGDTFWRGVGKDFIIKFKTEYLEGYCQTTAASREGCKYIDKESQYLISAQTAVIKFET